MKHLTKHAVIYLLVPLADTMLEKDSTAKEERKKIGLKMDRHPPSSFTARRLIISTPPLSCH